MLHKDATKEINGNTNNGFIASTIITDLESIFKTLTYSLQTIGNLDDNYTLPEFNFTAASFDNLEQMAPNNFNPAFSQLVFLGQLGDITWYHPKV